MAKERFITRRIAGIQGDMLVNRVDTHEVWEEKFRVPGKFDTSTDKGMFNLLSTLKRLYDTGDKEVLKVLYLEEIESVYTISEEDFVKYGKIKDGTSEAE